MSKKKTEKSPFILWLESKSLSQLSTDTGISMSNLHHWKSGVSCPGLRYAQIIVQYTKGEITYDTIYSHYFSTDSKFKKFSKQPVRLAQRKKKEKHE